jgi:TonB family protein
MFVGQQIEKAHPTIFRDVDVTFELNVPAPERPVMPVTKPDYQRQSARGNAQPALAGKSALAESLSFMPENTSPQDVGSAVPAATVSPIALDAASPSSGRPREMSDTGLAAVGEPTGWGDDEASSQDSGEPAAISEAENSSMAAQRSSIRNIRAYKQDLLARLAKLCKPVQQHDRIIITLTVSRAGRAIRCELIESSGSDQVDREVLEAAKSAEYAPVPAWYKGEQLTFRLDLSTAHDEQR